MRYCVCGSGPEDVEAHEFAEPLHMVCQMETSDDSDAAPDPVTTRATPELMNSIHRPHPPCSSTGVFDLILVPNTQLLAEIGARLAIRLRVPVLGEPRGC